VFSKSNHHRGAISSINLRKRVQRFKAINVLRVYAYVLLGFGLTAVAAVAVIRSGLKISSLQDLGAVASILYGGIGLIAILIYGDQLFVSRNTLRHQEQVSRAGFVKDLVASFFANHEERLFFYRLDYREWKFLPDQFRMSDDEVLLDNLFYRLSYVGMLVNDGILDVDDVYILRFILRDLIENEEIQKYFAWVHQDVPGAHDLAYGFMLYLYWRIYGMTAHLASIRDKAPNLFKPLAKVSEPAFE
jgi:hypothetical protein